uniref:TPR_REGION domain-containing protein n=1 Tax=Panagrellus redivivus TaxID=6233 RepID=A0A7E4W893_PANRE
MASAKVSDQLDPFYKALLTFRINKIDECHEICSKILERNPLDQAAWSLKLACFTEEVFVDELENDEAGLADTYMDDNVIATAARPGTSFARPITTGKGPSPAVRPRSSTGRPISGMARPESRLKTGTMEQALRTSRTSRTARAASSSTARQVRLGTASMVAQQDGPFVNLGRLNVEKYAGDSQVNRYLFEYVFMHEGDMRMAHQIAAVATKTADYKDWYWKNALGKTYYRLGMIRESEKQFLSSLKNTKMVETYAYLSKVYARLDQPISALDHLNAGLEVFPNDVTLLTFSARIHENLGDLDASVTMYKHVLRQAAGNVEAIACMGTHFFYSDQPEVALKYYRRILQMGVNKPELLMNIGLCCFYCQQFDLALGCVDQALTAATDDVSADLWYNAAHIMLANCNTKMAQRCLRLALAANPDHAESLCNLGVLKMHEGNNYQAKNLFTSATIKGPNLFETHYNLALLCSHMGFYAEALRSVKQSLALFPEHVQSKQLLSNLMIQFTQP